MIALTAFAATAATAGAVTVAAGGAHSCAIARSGEVYCWGANSTGQLGNGSTTDSFAPVRVTGPIQTTALAAGTSHTCALLGDGSVQCWGVNTNGQLGDGTTAQSATPVTVSGIADAVQITAGASHTCALLGDGTASCWGANAAGQLGDGTTTQSTVPTPVAGLISARSIAAGDSHTCATASGNAYCWGLNTNGQLGDGSTSQRTSPTPVSGVSGALWVVAGAGHSCALSATVQCWGLNTNGQLGDGSTTQRLVAVTVGSLSGVTRLSAGGSHTCAAESTPAVKCWGLNAEGQIGDGGTTQRTAATAVSGIGAILALDAGGNHNCAVSGTGEFKCWGAGGSGQIGDGSSTARSAPAAVSGLAGVVAAAVGSSHSCAALANGPAPASRASYCWGADGSGQLGDYDTTQKVLPSFTYYLDNAFALAGGQAHSCAVVTGGQAMCWGNNNVGQSGTGLPDSSFTTVQNVSGLSTATDIAAGTNHSCAIESGGQATCWGANGNGQLGDGTTTAKDVPTNVSGLTTATKLSAGGTNGCAVVSGGQAKCWGRNDLGQTGNGNTASPQSSPVNVSGLSNAMAIATGVTHSCAIISGGTVKCWGNNGNGQLGNNSTVASSTPVAVTGVAGATALELGDYHSCAVVALGAVKCWGAGGFGQLGNGLSADSHVPVDVSGLLGAKSIAAGGNQTCAVAVGGRMDCWGYGYNGQLGNGTTANRSTPIEVDLLDALVLVDNIPEGAFLQNPHPSISFSTLDSVSPILECNFDGAGWSVCSSPYDPGVLATGRHSMQVRATEANTGLLSYTSVSFAVGVTMPTVTINSPTSGGVANDTTPSVDFDVTGTNPLSTDCKVDAGSFASCATGYTTAMLPDGAHSVTVRVTDGNSNTASAAVTFTVDSTAPNTTIDSGPPPASASTNASFAFSANESASFACRLDAGSWNVCDSAYGLSSLAQGAHSFNVRATDTAGNTDATPATRSWNVDTVSPVVSIGAPVNASFTNDNTPALGFSVTEVNSYTTTCSIDGGAYAACDSASNLPTLADGAHTLIVRATDAATNEGSASAGFTVDTVAPNTSISANPPANSNSTGASFSFSATETVTFECRIDGGAWGVCAGSKSYVSLTQGSHTFQVRATDQAANTDATPAGYTWNVDTVSPDTTIDSGPPSFNASTSASLNFSASESATFQCSLDGVAYSFCSSPQAPSGLAQGAHSFNVRATDAAGNTDATPATRSWNVDTVSPVVSIGAPVNASFTNDNTPALGFSVTEVISYTTTCSIDGGAYTACSSASNLPTLADGAHTLTVRATDAAGNEGSASAGFTVDTVAPAVSIVSPANLTTTGSTAPPVSFTATDVTSITVECRVDAGGWTGCASPYVPSPALANGPHSIAVRATDQAGLVGSASINITVDTTLPTVTITAPANGLTTADSTPWVTFAATGGTIALRECKVDGGSFVSCVSGFDLTAVADGAHTLTVRVTDALARTATDSVAYTVDSVDPAVTISTPAPGATITSLVPSIAFSAVDATAISFQCGIDIGAFVDCASPFAPILAAGAHSVSVRATDAAGNQGSSLISFTLALPASPAPAPGSGTQPAPPADSAPGPVAFTPVLFAIKKAARLKLVLALNPPSGIAPSCSGTVLFSGTLMRAKIKAAAALKLFSGKCVATATAKVKRTLRGKLKLTASHAGTQQIAPVKLSKTLKVR